MLLSTNLRATLYSDEGGVDSVLSEEWRLPVLAIKDWQ